MKELFPKDFVFTDDEHKDFRIMESADFFFVVDTRKNNQVELMTAGKLRADLKRAIKVRDNMNSVVYQARKELGFV